MERDTPTAAAAYPTGRGIGGRGPTPQPEGLIDEVTRDIRAATASVFELTHALRQHNDDTLGAEPQASNGAHKAVDSPFRGDNLRNSISVLRGAIDELRGQVIRARNI